MRCPIWLNCASGARARAYRAVRAWRHGAPSGSPWALPKARPGPRCGFWPRPTTFRTFEYNFKTLENRLRELRFLNSGVRIILEDQSPGRAVERQNCSTRAVCANLFAIWTGQSTSVMPRKPIYINGEGDWHWRGSRDVVERQLSRKCAALYQQYPAARWRHAYGRLFAARLTRTHQRLCAIERDRQEREGQLYRRRCARGADLCAVGESARSRNFPAKPKTSWSVLKCVPPWKAL